MPLEYIEKMKKAALAYSRKNRFVLFALIVFTFVASSSAYSNMGTNDFPVLRLSFDARAIGMGNAYTAMAEGVHGLAWNPAGLAQIGRPEVLIGYKSLPVDVHAGVPAYARRIKGKYGIGLSARYINYGSFAYVDENNVETGLETTPISFVGSAGIGKKINKKFSAGVCVKGVYEKLADDFNQKGLAIDMGVRYLPDFRRTGLGLVVQNIGAHSSSKDFSLPTTLNAGVTNIFSAMPRTRLALDIAMPFNFNDDTKIIYDENIEYRLGFEVRQSRNLFLRGGYTLTHPELARVFKKVFQNKSYDNAPEHAQSWSLGAGFKQKKLTIDYAIQSWERFGFMHAVSLHFLV